MENVEIEKKWRVAKLPEDLTRFECIDMEQAYLNTHPTVRIRRENEEYFLTYKGISENDVAHAEYNLPLTEEAFRHLLEKCDGRILRKTRYKMPVEGYPSLTAELDIFSGELEGLVILEVEFPSVEEALSFDPPAWYGKDVTEDPAYHNSAISRGADPR